MRVSYLELFAHCKKVFIAHGIHEGSADDGSESVAWGTFCGLNAYNILANKVENNQIKENKGIEAISEKDDYYRLDADGQTHFAIGRLIAEYAFVKSKAKDNCVIQVENVITSKALACQSHYLAKKGKASIFSICNINDTPTWILATTNEKYPYVVSGQAVDQMIREKILAQLNETYLPTQEQNELVIYMLEEDFITEVIKSIQEMDEQLFDERMTADLLKSNFEQAHEDGQYVERETWEMLREVGTRTLVESTEQSRLQGAGEQAD